LNLSGNIISVLPSVQLKALQELTVQDNPLVFPPFDIVSRGLAHILAFLSRNKQKGLYSPPLQQEQYGEEEDLEETSSSRQSPNHSSDTLLSSTASRPSSAMAVLTWQQCNSPLTSNRGQRHKPFIRTGSSHFERHIIRRRSSQPEFYKHDVTESGDTDCSSVSLSSLSEERISAFESQQPCSSQQLEKEGCHRRMSSSYLSISYNQQVRYRSSTWLLLTIPHYKEQLFYNPLCMIEKMNQEHCRLILGSSDRPQPPPRSTRDRRISPAPALIVPSAVASGCKLYVRQRTPSPPPRKPQPLVPLPRMSNASLSKARPLLRPQRSYSPTMHSPSSRLPNDRSQTRVFYFYFTWQMMVKHNYQGPSIKFIKQIAVKRVKQRGVVEGSDDDSSTDSSCEDLPVPRLRNHFPLNVTSSLSTQHHLTPRPRQSIPPNAASLHQHHRYLKHGQATESVQPKVNPNLFLRQQLASQVRRRPYRDDRSNATFSPSYETLPSPRPLYPQTHQYDELWRSTAESLRMVCCNTIIIPSSCILVSHLDINLPSTPVELANELKTGICLAEFLNSFLGYKAIKKVSRFIAIYEVSGSSWRFRARQNLFSSREVIHNVGVPKHRLFSVTRVLAGDTTVGLFGLLHCLQTLLEVWASRPSTFVLGGLGVREKLTNQPTPYRSLLGDITTNRRIHHQSQQRNRYPTLNSNYGVGVNDYGGVFSDV
uniref:NTF2 domain-containing protein n=1 Tax=Hydatigena taeniaeformis TaxID=6205 RepID=A0A158REP7_HYDTA